jgi:hypothetical protein
VCVECSEQPRGVRVYCATTGRSVVDVDVIRGSTAGHRQRAHTCQSRRQTFLYSQPNCNLDSTRDKYVRYGEAFPPARSAGAWVQGVAVVRGWPGVGQSSDQHTTCACLCGRMLHLGGQPGEGARWEVAFAQSSCDRETAAASNGGAAAAAPYGSDRRFDEMEYDGVADSSSMGWFGAFAAPLARLEAHVRARQGHKLSHMQSTIEPMKRLTLSRFSLLLVHLHTHGHSWATARQDHDVHSPRPRLHLHHHTQRSASPQECQREERPSTPQATEGGGATGSDGCAPKNPSTGVSGQDLARSSDSGCSPHPRCHRAPPSFLLILVTPQSLPSCSFNSFIFSCLIK